MFLDRKCKGRYSQLSDSKHSKKLIFSEKTILSAPFQYKRCFYFSTLFKALMSCICIVIFLLLMASCKHILSFAKTLILHNMSG